MDSDQAATQVLTILASLCSVTTSPKHNCCTGGPSLKLMPGILLPTHLELLHLPPPC